MNQDPTYEELFQQNKILEVKLATLEKSEKLHRLTLENISDTVLITDNLGEIIFACPNAEFIFGYTQDEVFSFGGVNNLLDGEVCSYEFLKEKGEINNIEWLVRDKYGKKHNVLINVKIVTFEDECILWVIRDITEFQKYKIIASERHEMLEDILNNTPAIIFIKDLEGRYLFINRQCEKVLKISNEEIIGKKINDILPGDLADQFVKNDSELISGNANQVLEEYIPSETGTITVLSSQFPLFNSKNEKYAFCGISVDITEHKLTERKLQDAIIQLTKEVEARKSTELLLLRIKERYRAIVMDQNELVCRFDQKGKITFINDSYCAFYGVNHEDILGTNFLPNIHKEDLWKVENHFKNLDAAQPERTIEHRVLLPNGAIHWQQWSGRALFDEQGNLSEYQAVGRDITDQKNAEKDVEESLLTLRTVLDSIDAMVYVRDLNSHEIIFANSYLENLFGKVLGKKCWQVTRRDLSGPCEDCPKEYLLDEQGEPDGVYTREIWNDINKRWYHTKDRVIRWIDGRLVHLQIATDITDRKYAEQGLQEAKEELEKRVERRTVELENKHAQVLHFEKLAAIGRLSACIAHEFNNPLAGVSNILYGIQKRAVYDEEDARLLDLGIKECDRMSDLIHNLRDFNRPTTGKAEELDLEQLVDSVLILLRKRIDAKGLIINKLFSDSATLITGVGDQLKQVFLNLINNAIDACEDKGEIIISSNYKDGIADIQIRDNGIGIPPQELALIFEPFYTTKSEVTGSGLGLTISHSIIREHGGDVKVKSIPGEGTVFFVTIPIHRAKDGAP